MTRRGGGRGATSPGGAAADEAGLPQLGFLTDGSVLLRRTVDPATGESTTVDGLQLDADVVDLCDAFGD
ncbi:hypothetical protein [Geodermatophilus poikilotrophus]|uniref:hypothetical protein n=1 Tax=Geodermatophilus poikilotrophus TaxID=1333667 RepID=UPI000B88248A|nr:hypothetical protein [Geodermatophilus poikilotrophus]